MSTNPIIDLASLAVDHAKVAGAQEVAVTVSRSRFIDLEHREGTLEKICESSSSGLGLALFIDGRFSTHSTSDLRPAALRAFIDRAVPMTRLLSVDPHRGLADPKLYENRPTDDLEKMDTAYDEVDTERRIELAAAVETAALERDPSVISVTAGYYDTVGETVRIHSNGFQGASTGTQYWMGAQVSVRDEDDKKPRGSEWVGARFHAELGDPVAVGKKAAERAMARRGQTKLASGDMTLVIDNRASGSLVSHLLGAMTGSAIQQQRSFLVDKLGQSIGSSRLTIIDDPLIPRAFGSRHYDSDGISCKRRVLVDAGNLESYLIGVYYARKLGVDPTGGGISNLVMALGDRDRDAMIAGVDKGVLVTGFLGGNSDSTRGDFSLGIVGFSIEGGKLGAPVGEINMTGNHTEFWHKLVEVGNDPYLYSTMRFPSMVFDGVAISGV